MIACILRNPIALTLLTLVACTPRGERATADRSNRLTIVCDPALCGGPFGDTRMLLFLPLTTDDVYDGGEPKPMLAERWEHSTDYRQWTIYLRPGVRWHDGHPVTARDIEFTMRLWAHPEVLHANHVPFDSVSVLDDLTLRIKYRKPSRAPLASGIVYYPRHVLERLDPRTYAEWEFWRQPTVGNGPYRLVRHAWESAMELEANPDYFAGKPAIDRVTVKYATPMLSHLLSGEVDVISGVDQTAIPQLGRDTRFKVYYQVIPAARVQILWNQRHAPLRQAVVRRALTMALDRRGLHGTLNLPTELALTEGVFTAHQYRHGDLIAPLPYDPKAAESLLEAEGWQLGSDGVREREGTALRFSLLVSAGGYLGQPAQAAVYIQAQLRRIGVRVDIEPRQVHAAIERIHTGDFQAAIWYTGVSQDIVFFGPDSPLGYSNPRAFELLNSAKVAPRVAERDSLYRELAIIFRQDMPATFLYPKSDANATHGRVGGLESPYRGDPFWFLSDMWLDGPEHSR